MEEKRSQRGNPNQASYLMCGGALKSGVWDIEHGRRGHLLPLQPCTPLEIENSQIENSMISVKQLHRNAHKRLEGKFPN